MKHELVYNAIRTPDGTLLESLHRHDYRTYTDDNGCMYGVDGGLDYIRRIGAEGAESLAVYADEPFEKVRKFAYRIGRDKGGKGAFVRIPICGMSAAYLAAVTRHLEEHLDAEELERNTHYRLLRLEGAWRQSKNVPETDEKSSKMNSD